MEKRTDRFLIRFADRRHHVDEFVIIASPLPSPAQMIYHGWRPEKYAKGHCFSTPNQFSYALNWWSIGRDVVQTGRLPYRKFSLKKTWAIIRDTATQSSYFDLGSQPRAKLPPSGSPKSTYPHHCRMRRVPRGCLLGNGDILKHQRSHQKPSQRVILRRGGDGILGLVRVKLETVELFPCISDLG